MAPRWHLALLMFSACSDPTADASFVYPIPQSCLEHGAVRVGHSAGTMQSTATRTASPATPVWTKRPPTVGRPEHDPCSARFVLDSVPSAGPATAIFVKRLRASRTA